MKKISAAAILSLILALIALPASAQIPGTGIQVINTTDDHAAIGLVVESVELRRAIPWGGKWGTFYTGFFGTQVPVEIRICGSTSIGPATEFPPDWAMKPEIAGPSAVTEEYLATNPAKHDVESRVKAIKRFAKDRLVGKAEIHRLDAWLSRIKVFGLTITAARCENPAQVLSVVFPIYANTWSSVLCTVMVRGSAGSYSTTGPSCGY